MIKKRFLSLIVSMLLVSVMMPNALSAQSKEAKVTLPTFQVSLNGTPIDNSFRQYPLIVYKDITYFPMTYYDSRFLGLETKWSGDTGLEIDKTGIAAAYRDYNGDARNGKTYTATIPSFDIKVNGEAVNQADEEYPLLVFRDVTYFPLTWRFAVDAFGWDYRFDSDNGLVIQSTNPQMHKVNLPGYTGGDLIAVGGHYYYEGEDGAIYQSPTDRPEQANKVYQLPVWSYGDGNAYATSSLSVKDDEAWLVYHQGGAIMGSDHYVKLKQDGTVEEAERGYLTFRSFGDVTIKVGQGVPPGPNNLYMKAAGQEYKPIGDPAYLYGWNWEQTEASSGGGASKDLYLVNNHVYLMAFHMGKDTDVSRIHKVNIETGETARVSDLKAKSFVIEGETMYFTSEGKLYRLPLAGGKEELLPTTEAVSEDFAIQVLNGKVYYVGAADQALYAAGTDASLHAGGKVTGLKLEKDYLIGSFAKENGNPYGMIVFDKEGEAVYRSADDVAYPSADNGTLTYAESGGSNVYTVTIDTE